MKNIYDNLNDIEIEIDEKPLTDREKKIMKNAAKSYSKKTFKWWKLVPVAAVVAIFLTFSNPGVMATGISIANDIRISLVDTFGSSTTVEDYQLGTDGDIQMGDRAFNLQSMAIDGDTVYTNTVVEGTLADMDSNPDLYYIKVDGKKYNVIGTSSGIEELEGNLLLYTMVNHLNKKVDITDAENIEVGFYDGKNLAKIHLDTPSKNIANVTEVLKENYTIPGSDGYILEYIKTNPITITAKITNIDPGTVLEIYGRDSSGNIIELDQRYGDDTESEFIFNSDFSDVDVDYFLENYGDFTFTVYSWEMESGDKSLDSATQIGNSFTLE